MKTKKMLVVRRLEAMKLDPKERADRFAAIAARLAERSLNRGGKGSEPAGASAPAKHARATALARRGDRAKRLR